MNLNHIDLELTNSFSSIFLDYITENHQLRPFYHHLPQISGFENKIKERNEFQSGTKPEHRNILKNALTNQYKNISNPPLSQIASLSDSQTFTVTTGHQLNIFTGPLYFIYKIVSTINLAKELKSAFPAYNFIPVYWMATEDHDFEEINHFHLFNKTYSWQTEQKGAVGRMETSEIKKVLEELPEKITLFEEAYLNHKNLADATRFIVHNLFGEYGLLCVDGDDLLLKKSFIPVIKDDIFNQNANDLVNDTSAKLETLGYKTQVTARKINFFYLDKNIRERIVQKENHFEVLNTNVKFEKSELNRLIEQHPEKFSPNVVTRPLYQEYVLPNLAYTGGPGELAYWLQLKDVFDNYKISFPILMPRNFALLINKPNVVKMQKIDIEPKELFKEINELKQDFIQKNAAYEISIENEKLQLENLFDQVKEKAVMIDKSLEGWIGAEQQKALKSLENIEKRLKKAEEQNQETKIKQLLGLKEKLFPDKGLQERYDNFLNFYLNEPNFIQILLDKLSVFDFRMHIFTEEI